jgi:hypothetical protein
LPMLALLLHIPAQHGKPCSSSQPPTPNNLNALFYLGLRSLLSVLKSKFRASTQHLSNSSFDSAQICWTQEKGLESVESVEFQGSGLIFKTSVYWVQFQFML